MYVVSDYYHITIKHLSEKVKNMKITDTYGSMNYNRNFVSISGHLNGFQKKSFIRKENSDSVNISEDAARMYRQQNSSPLAKTMSKMLQNPVEQIILSEQSWDAIRHREVEKLSGRIKTGQYDFESSEILDRAGSRVLELL